MSALKVLGIVARYANYREYDRMLTIITPEGSMDVVARSCRRPKSPLLACTQPFSYGEFVLFKNKDKYSLTQCDLRESFYDLRTDLTRLSVASYVVEACSQLSTSGSSSQELFALAYYSLSFLCYGEVQTLDLLLCFLVKLLQMQGVRPATTACALCNASTYESPVFNSTLGGALCKQCGEKKGGKPLKPLSLEAIRRMIQLPLTRMDSVVLPDHVRCELFDVLIDYFEHHFERRFKPLDFVREFCKL